ncbi:MAG: NAD(P)-dependent oxidoreductase [Pseudomonadota bacterium]
MSKALADDRAVLITGSTGFVGFHLAKRLLADGRSVHLIVRKTSRRTRLATLPGAPIVHEHDGGTEQMLTIFRDVSPGTVFHLASAVVSEHKPEDIERLVRSNLLFGVQLLEGSVRAGVARFINTGTFWQHYGGHDYDPASLYAATKKGFEDLMRYYLNACGLTGLTLELPDTYGPEDDRHKLFPQLRAASLSAAAPLPLSPGEQRIAPVHVEDVVNAYLHAERLLVRDPELSGKSFAVTSKEVFTLQEIVKIYETELGRRVPIEWGGRPYRHREMMEPHHSQLLPGWSPAISLREGLRTIL